MPALAILLVAALALSACGDDSREAPRTETAPEDCPAGTADLAPRDVLPQTPPGTALGRAARFDAKRYREPFEQGLGDRLRSVRIGVVTEHGRAIGTAVVVVNSTERMGDPRDVLRGAQDSARPGANPRAYTIAGRPGMISEESDGAIAAVSISTCALVMLSGQDTPMVKRIAGELRSPE